MFSNSHNLVQMSTNKKTVGKGNLLNANGTMDVEGAMDFASMNFVRWSLDLSCRSWLIYCKLSIFFSSTYSNLSGFLDNCLYGSAIFKLVMCLCTLISSRFGDIGEVGKVKGNCLVGVISVFLFAFSHI